MEKTLNQAAILGAIKLLVDGAKDIKKSLEPDQSLLQRVEDFGNLIPDFFEELKVIGDLKAEIALLQPSDIPAIAAVLVADLEITDAHAKRIADAALKLIEAGAGGFAPDLLALIHAIEGLPEPTPEPAKEATPEA